MATIVKSIGMSAVLLALSACSKLGMGQDQMSFARDALDRNERLQVVASDPQAKTFTVRVKDSGQLVVIPVDQLVAGPSGALLAPAMQTAASPSAAAPAGGPPAPPVPESAGPSQAAVSGSPALASSSAGDEAAPPGDAGSERRGFGGQGESADRDSRPSDTGPHAETAANAKAGSVLAAGPGYSIKASGPKGGPARQSPVTAARGAPERLHDPIICQGARLLHIDNRNLEFDGDAITAEDGCEIHITNTHISAKGIGVLARAANVHIKNSEIDGDSGSVDASDGAQVYAESSRFKGLTRRLESSAFHDLGGNVWN